MRLAVGFLVALAALPELWAQAPAVVDGGVINAASFAKNQVVTPGSLVSIFGTNLASSTTSAAAIPLPTSLAGVSVKFNGIDAPLIFVAPGQINAQLPWEVLGGSQNGAATVVVTTPGGTSAPKTLNIGPFSPGIFSISFGVGQAIAINLDGTLAARAGSVPGLTTHPAKPGDVVIILGTGLGTVTPSIATGTSPAASDNLLRTAATTPTVLFGGQASTNVIFAGLSPQFVGVNQINAQIPANAPGGDSVSVQLSEGGITSTPAVTMAIAGATPAVQVPAEFQDLYSQLKDDLDRFNAMLDSSWNGSNYPVNFAADLYIADNSAKGKILQPDYYTRFVTPFLDALQGLGVKAVKLTVSFPILYQPYYSSPAGANNPGDYQQTLDFYVKLANDVHARGLKLIADSQAVHPADQPSIASFYQTLDVASYMAGRSTLLQTLAQQLKPDYLILQAEPQTEENDLRTSLPSLSAQIHSASNDAAMLSGFLNDLNKAGLHSGIVIGAGMGTWQHDFLDFQSSMLQIPGLDLFDIHVYPVNDNGTDFLQRILTASDAARAAGKKVGMSEAWLYKVRDSELGKGFTSTELYARDAYSFWSPLDQEFIDAMYKTANFKQFDYMSLFFDKYFFAYLNYDQVPTTSTPASMMGMSNSALAAALLSHSLTSTGLYYQNLIHP